MKYLIISLLIASSYADAIITIKEKNGTIVSQKRIISKKIVEKEKQKQENKDPYAEEIKKFNENVFGRIKTIQLGRNHRRHCRQNLRRCGARLGKGTPRPRRLHGTHLPGGRALLGADGAPLASLHRGAVRAHRVDVHPPLPH